MRDLTVGLDAGSNSNFGRLLFDFRIAQKEGKTAPNLLFLLIERRKEKCNNKKRLTIFAISRKTNSIMSATMILQTFARSRRLLFT